MKQIIMLIFILCVSLNAYEFKLTKSDIQHINKSKNKSFIINRLNKYQTLKKKVVNYELIRKLSHINTFINKVLPSHDIKSNNSLDYWATPKEFLIGGHGDCEDYAIAKYFTLLELGIKKEHLYFAVVDVKGRRDSHMILLYLEDKNQTPLVMDNLNFKVVPMTVRKRLIPKFAFNEIDSYQFNHEKFTKKVRINWGKEDKWNKLLYRVYNLKQ